METPRLTAHINPGVANLPGRDPEAQAVAESLLERDRDIHHCFFNAQGFHNHLSHHLLAAYDLGAPATLLQAIYDKECQIQKPIDASPPEHIEITPDNFVQYLGEARHYHAFLTFFTKRIKEFGVSQTIESYVFDSAVNVDGVQMLARFMSGVYHPLIQTGYGIEFGSDAMVAQGLAQGAVHTPLVSSVLDTAALGKAVTSNGSIKDERKRGTSLFYILNSLYVDDALRPVEYDADKSVIQYIRDTMKGDRAEGIKKLCATWWGSEEFETASLDDKVEELFYANVLLLCGTSKRGRMPRLDFILMHAMNATLFLPSLLKILGNTSKIQLLRAFLPVTIVYVLARGRPRIDVGLAMSYTATPRPRGWKPETLMPSAAAIGNPNETYNPWLNICASVIHAPDAHTAKAIRALYHAAQCYGHKKAGYITRFLGNETQQREALHGISRLDGTLFVRAAGVVMDTLGWVTHGDNPGKWDFSGLGWEEAWKD